MSFSRFFSNVAIFLSKTLLQADESFVLFLG
jgi:hypothetical protein